MLARSPLQHASSLRSPMLVFQGANDPRVTQPQSDSIVCALRRRNIAADYLLAGNEGHGFGNEETSLAVKRATEEFLGEHLGGRVQPRVESNVQQALASLRKAGHAVTCL
jgi:dipeptidyl aminopeptidase/acylaminoacyl peptidase